MTSIPTVPVIVRCEEGIPAELLADIEVQVFASGGEMVDAASADPLEALVNIPSPAVDSFCESVLAIPGVDDAFVPDSYYDAEDMKRQVLGDLGLPERDDNAGT